MWAKEGDYLKREDLIVGQKYKVIGRNFDEAVWNGERFIGMRYKFGEFFETEELHYDDDPKYGTVQPIEPID